MARKPTAINETLKIRGKCTCCEKEYPNITTSFYSSPSVLYKGNHGRVTVCKNCANKLYEEYYNIYSKDRQSALRAVCMKLDIYYNYKVAETVKGVSKGGGIINILGNYIAQMNMIQNKQYRDFTFDDTLHEESINSIQTPEDLARVNDVELLKLIDFWGKGFGEDEYKLLQNEYDDWLARCVVNTKAKEMLIKDICIVNIQMKRSLINNDTETHSKLSITRNKMLNEAHLSPSQTDKDEDDLSELTMGQMIKRFENDKPVRKKPEYSEFRKIYVMLIGHLVRMFNLKLNNPITKEYNKIIKELSVSPEESNEIPSEELYDMIMQSNKTIKNKAKVVDDDE